jgi:beta-N-acetylhexosaminidase
LAETFLTHGILPVIKHFPGHGRLLVDPHAVLPKIDAPLEKLERDFAPFAALNAMPIGMNSHAVFAALDPSNPASLSAKVNIDIVRGKLGFDGLLFSDDICMKALQGPAGNLARRAIEAGNDIVLHCNGNSDEMAAIGLALDPMGDAAWARWQRAKSMVAPLNPAYNPAQDAAQLDVMLGGLAAGI